MHVRTTHDPHGGGHARLLVSETVHADQAAGEHRSFALLSGVTAIGSGTNADLRLPGLDEHHADVRRDAADEYVYVHLGTRTRSMVDGRLVREKVLHSGDRISLGAWTLVYFRDEFADHGRPFGGRQGGEFSHQRGQHQPRARGTSVQGGSDPAGDDPGEYF